MSILWWHWIVLGFALCLAELAVPALILVWLGISALVLGLLTLLVSIPLTAQVLIWIVLSMSFTLLWLKIFKPRSSDVRVGASSEMIGQSGLLVVDVEPYGKGEVLFQRPLLGSDRWQCVADGFIKAGSRVRVVSVEGSSVKVAEA